MYAILQKKKICPFAVLVYSNQLEPCLKTVCIRKPWSEDINGNLLKLKVVQFCQLWSKFGHLMFPLAQILVLYGPLRSTVVHCGPMWSNVVQCGPILATFVQFIYSSVILLYGLNEVCRSVEKKICPLAMLVYNNQVKPSLKLVCIR